MPDVISRAIERRRASARPISGCALSSANAPVVRLTAASELTYQWDNLAIDSKLRGCDVVAIRVDDVAPNGYTLDRATVRQRKTGRPVRFEITEQTRQAIDDYLKLAGRQPGQFLFAGRGGSEARGLTTRQYARLVGEWIASIGLDPLKFGTHSQGCCLALAEPTHSPR